MKGFASLVPRGVDGERAISAWGDWPGESPSTWSGPVVNVGNASQLLTVYACARFICDGIATLPVDVYRGTGDNLKETNKPPWLEQPTPDLDRVAWTTQVLWSLLIAGNCYLRLYWQDNRLTALQPLDPNTVNVQRVNGRKTFFVNGQQAGELDILHIPGVMYPGSEIGLSPVEAARQSIGLGLAALEYGGKFFDQGATLAGVIETPGDLPATGDGSAPGLAKQFMRRHSGKKKAHLPLVLQGGATWKTTGVTNDQAQFLATRQYTAAEIASQMFLIDPTEFGISMDKGSSITYSNLEQRNARKVTVTFLPWIIRIEHALSGLLPSPRYVKFNVNGLLRGDTKTRFETYEIASRINTAAAADGEAPLLLTSEMRGLEDLPKLPAPLAPVPSTEDQ